MAVRIEKTFQVKAPIDQAWALLSDPRNVASCIPGAQITEAVDDKTFRGSIRVKVGPSVTDYKGEVHIDRLDPEAHEMELSGKGLDVRGKGSAAMKMTGTLRALPDGGTEVVTVSEVNVVGMLAQFGGRMIKDVSDVMFKEFSQRFQEQLERGGAPPPPDAPAPEPINAVRLVSSALGRSVRRAFTGSDEGDEKA
jgi:carbon monoxide dehydrogenase subunit G